MSNESMTEVKSVQQEPGIQQDQKGLWGKLMIVVNFIKWLIGIFYPQLTEAERDAAGIHLEHQSDE